jgi:PUB domain/Ubiquitin family
MTKENAIMLTLQLTVTAEQGAPRVPLTIPKTITATTLRERVSETTKIPKASLKLIFRGRLIADDDSKEAVPEFKLEDGSVVHCMGKPVKDVEAAEPSATAVPASSTARTAAASMPSVPIVRPNVGVPVVPVAPVDPLQAALQTLRASTSPGDYLTAVSTLEKVLSNIANNPMEDKYRKVKKENAAFQRRLGGRNGGDAAMQACGFSSGTDNGEEVYSMQASADAWPKLMASKATVAAAVSEAQSAANQATAPPVPSMPGMGTFTPGFGGGIGSPGMHDAVQNIMANPAALQNMLQVRKQYSHRLWGFFVSYLTVAFSICFRILWYKICCATTLALLPIQ